MGIIVKLFNGSWKAFKTVMKVFILGFVLLFIIGIFATSGEDTISPTETTGTTATEEIKEKPKKLTVVEKYSLQVIETSTGALGTFEVVGTLVADKDYSYIQIEIPCYDAEGNNVGSAIANASNIGKGETWKFEATQFDGGAVDCNIEKADVTGF